MKNVIEDSKTLSPRTLRQIGLAPLDWAMQTINDDKTARGMSFDGYIPGADGTRRHVRTPIYNVNQNLTLNERYEMYREIHWRLNESTAIKEAKEKVDEVKAKNRSRKFRHIEYYEDRMVRDEVKKKGYSMRDLRKGRVFDELPDEAKAIIARRAIGLRMLECSKEIRKNLKRHKESENER